MVLPGSHRISRVLWYSGYPRAFQDFEYWTFTTYGSAFQRNSSIYPGPTLGPTTPTHRSRLVWPSPISLAATLGVSFDFRSSGYWDVSLPLVSFSRPNLFQSRIIVVHNYWVSPFGYLRIKVCLSTPRRFSQTCHVLHRRLAPRHSPRALSSYLSYYMVQIWFKKYQRYVLNT